LPLLPAKPPSAHKKNRTGLRREGEEKAIYPGPVKLHFTSLRKPVNKKIQKKFMVGYFNFTILLSADAQAGNF
jgi:hypothetical protein